MDVVCKLAPLMICLFGRVLTLSCSVVGAEDGIYEFHVDLFNRKLFPSITMR